MDDSIIQGFSKFNKQERIDALIRKYGFQEDLDKWLATFENSDVSIQKLIEDMSENPVSSFHLPFTIAPNFVVNGKNLFFPLVSEESSVVAALANAAGYWARRGGLHAEVLGTEKKGQVHFIWNGNPEYLRSLFPEIRSKLLAESDFLTTKMKQRGGGITGIELKSLPQILPNYFQLDVGFETCDAMGANFINSCLEQFGKSLQEYFRTSGKVSVNNRECEIIMAILSNYTPESRVRAWVECRVTNLLDGKLPQECELFARKFEQAIRISQVDVSRAVTHNKGIFNGIDALAIATGNDFRAIEACGHAFAARNGLYAGLTDIQLQDGKFRFSIELALAVGVVGGVTAVHPMAKLAMKILDNPSAKELMMYLAVAGLASNFGAVKALVSVGIQQGHMKMHLSNIMNQLQIPEVNRAEIQQYFQDKTVSYSAVEEYWLTIN
ncbi:MAG: hydroxymethylglutaryl-CoA reductase [Bacteroidota bacterium]|nr:hydroxymethylglutaryl-CoA reductase [Odoribacter sp.]MDP3643418.1 hydroxymethylglutaryl-CoA reductase [Bacteroidota bacterium]